MKPEKSLMERYALKTVNTKFYDKINIDSLKDADGNLKQGYVYAPYVSITMPFNFDMDILKYLISKKSKKFGKIKLKKGEKYSLYSRETDGVTEYSLVGMPNFAKGESQAIVEPITEEQINNIELFEIEEFPPHITRKQYDILHAACPNCGSTSHGTTLMGAIYEVGKDFEDKINRVWCKCSWSGTPHDLVPEK